MVDIELYRLPYELTVCKAASMADIDLDAGFFFVARTDEELSLVCRTEDAPLNAVAREDGWRGFRVGGTLDFSLVGILSGLCGVLAENKIAVFAVSTYNTDYILVRGAQFDRASDAFRAAGYTVI